MTDPAEVIWSIEDVLDTVDVERATESELRQAVRKISELVSSSEEEEVDEDDDEDDDDEDDEEEDEEEVEVDEEGEEVPWK